jgi:glyoxylase-like metal-dependent hydrolase (beta-lactamase superfamily II)
MQNKRTCLTRAVTAVLALSVASLAMAQTQTDIHRDAATRNVGGDEFMMKYARAFYCNLPDNNNAIVLAARAWNNTTGANNNQYRIPVTQIFDDVWFVGNHYVGQYMIKTADGLVQVDAGNNATEFQTFNYPALQSLGLNASYPLKAIFLTHGHGDHDGGAKWALDNLGAKSYLGSADAANKPYNPTQIDSTNLRMREMSIGGKKFWVLPTPGHTPGSTSAVLEVQDWGQTRRVLMNGGQSMTSSIPQVAQYLDSIERTYAMASVLNVDGVMTPHIYWDGEGVKLDEINATGRTKPSQNIYGHESVMRQLAVARECSAAWLTKLDATQALPVWRFNTIEFIGGNPTPTKVAAQVKNGWGTLANQKVTFSVSETGAACTATTNAEGIASCDIRPLRPHKDKVTASFAGSQSTDFVDLPAEATAQVCSNGNCNTK